MESIAIKNTIGRHGVLPVIQEGISGKSGFRFTSARRDADVSNQVWQGPVFSSRTGYSMCILPCFVSYSNLHFIKDYTTITISVL